MRSKHYSRIDGMVRPRVELKRKQQLRSYLWFANGTCTGDVISHNYIHNMGTTAWTVVNGHWDNGSFDHNYHWGVFDGSVNHGESVQLQGPNSGSVIHHNLWRDQHTNGDVVSTDTGGNALSFSIYDNADICSPSTNCNHNDGETGCFGTGVCTVLEYKYLGLWRRGSLQVWLCDRWRIRKHCSYDYAGEQYLLRLQHRADD